MASHARFQSPPSQAPPPRDPPPPRRAWSPALAPASPGLRALHARV
jgi:hypothetical protein